MKSIIKIKFHDMRNLEFRGVQYQLLQMAQDIKTPGASSFIEDFRSSFQEMCQHFDSGLQDSPDRIVHNIHEERSSFYYRCRAVAKAAASHPNPTAREAGQKLWSIFQKFPSSARVNQLQAYGMIGRLVNNARSIGEDALECCGCKVWIDELDRINQSFLQADAERNYARGHRELKQSLHLRDRCTEAFDLIATFAKFQAAQGDISCARFIDSANAMLKDKKMHMAQRRNSKGNSSEIKYLPVVI